jgi:hypothetical protein
MHVALSLKITVGDFGTLIGKTTRTFDESIHQAQPNAIAGSLMQGHDI